MELLPGHVHTIPPFFSPMPDQFCPNWLLWQQPATHFSGEWLAGVEADSCRQTVWMKSVIGNREMGVEGITRVMVVVVGGGGGAVTVWCQRPIPHRRSGRGG